MEKKSHKNAPNIVNNKTLKVQSISYIEICNLLLQVE